MRLGDKISLFLVTLLLAVLLYPILVEASEITLTQSQVDAVLADNPTECPPVNECPPIDPPVEPPEPPVEPPVPSECVDSTDDSTIKGWTQVFFGAWPYPTYQNVTYQQVPIDGYYAIQFNTGNVVDDGKLSLLENPNTPGRRLASYSECKGDFNVPDECKMIFGLGGGMWWSTKNRGGACELKPNTTYYYNVTFKVDGESECVGEPCYISFQYSNL